MEETAVQFIEDCGKETCEVPAELHAMTKLGMRVIDDVMDAVDGVTVMLALATLRDPISLITLGTAQAALMQAVLDNPEWARAVIAYAHKTAGTETGRVLFAELVKEIPAELPVRGATGG